MNYKTISFGLGLFSVALGLAETLAPKRITSALDSEGHETLVRNFGLRELAAGAALLTAPAAATNVWGRVAGDALDIRALGLAARSNPRNGAVWGALGLVLGITLVDLLTARGLDAQTGKTSPRREHATI